MRRRIPPSSKSQLDTEFLAALLKEMGVCCTIEEAEAIAEAIAIDYEDNVGKDELDGGGTSDIVSAITENLMLYVDVDIVQAKEIIGRLQIPSRHGQGSCSDSSCSEEGGDEEGVNSSLEYLSTGLENPPTVDAGRDEDEDGGMLGDGECQLCDRYIRLTRHHLIPRSTWPRMQQRLLNAAICKDLGEQGKARKCLGPG